MRTFHPRRPSLRTGSALLAAVAIVGTGVGLSASGALTTAPAAAHHSRTAQIQVAAATVGDATKAANGTITTDTSIYPDSTLVGQTVGTAASGASFAVTCRTDTGSSPVVGIVPQPGGIGYVPAPSIQIGGTGQLPDCPVAIPGSSSGVAPTTYTAEQCAANTTNDILFSEFIKNWIGNNAQRWASDLTAKRDTDTPAPARSQIVSDAISQVSGSFYDAGSAFADALQTAIDEGTETYADCNAQADDGEAQWEDDTFARMAEEDGAPGWLDDVLGAIEDTIADAALQGVGSDDCKQAGTVTAC